MRSRTRLIKRPFIASLRPGRVDLEPLETRQLLSAAAAPTVPLNQAATDAWIYGLAPILEHLTEEQSTDVAAATTAGKAPINQLSNAATFPTAASKGVVRSNADTLYSTAFLDLSKGPIVLHQGDDGSRFVLFQLLNAYTDSFASLGSRTTGDQAQSYLIAGPNWIGKVPAGFELVKAPTNTVWIIGRTAALDTPADIAAVNALQQQYALTPLSQYGNPNYQPPTDVPVDPTVNNTQTPPQQALALTAQQYFTLLSQILRQNPPPAQDAAIIKEFAELGLGPATNFNWFSLTADQQAALTAGVSAGKLRLSADAASGADVTKFPTGWSERLTDIGTYGTDYDARALIAYGGLGANIPADAVYPSTSVDSNGLSLSGANNYVLHFDADQLPPAGAFWSVTLYNSSGYFVSNPINAYSLGSLHPDLQYNADGSLDLYIQSAQPAAGTTNWLPSPAGAAFSLSLRIYEPAPSVLSGAYEPPAVTLVPPPAANTAASFSVVPVGAPAAPSFDSSLAQSPSNEYDQLFPNA